MQQQARRAHTVTGNDHHFGGLKVFVAVSVEVDRAAGHAIGVSGDLAHPASGAQLHTGPDGGGPVSDVSAGLGALRATCNAVAQVDAGTSTFIVLGGHGAVGRPPVPAQLVQPLRQSRAGLAQRHRRHQGGFRRIGRVARQSGDAHHAIVQCIEGLEGLILDRPVVGHAIECAHLEVRRVKARKVPGIQHGAAAHAIEVGDLDRRASVIDRIVPGARAPVGAEVELAQLACFPVASIAGVIGGLDPVALLQAQDAHTGIGQAPCDGSPGCPGTDDQHIDRVVRDARRGHAHRPA